MVVWIVMRAPRAGTRFSVVYQWPIAPIISDFVRRRNATMSQVMSRLASSSRLWTSGAAGIDLKVVAGRCGMRVAPRLPHGHPITGCPPDGGPAGSSRSALRGPEGGARVPGVSPVDARHADRVRGRAGACQGDDGRRGAG